MILRNSWHKKQNNVWSGRKIRTDSVTYLQALKNVLMFKKCIQPECIEHHLLVYVFMKKVCFEQDRHWWWKNDSLQEFKMNKIITTNMSLYYVKHSRIRKGGYFSHWWDLKAILYYKLLEPGSTFRGITLVILFKWSLGIGKWFSAKTNLYKILHS